MTTKVYHIAHAQILSVRNSDPYIYSTVLVIL
jgi:hypothetical protein